MMSHVPSPDEYFEAGREVLNFAWAVCLEPILELKDYSRFEPVDSRDYERYWLVERRSQTIASTLVQQANEFYLKGKIAEVSPFLLLADSPRKWPLSKPGVPANFSDLRTIDAQDLVKALESASGAVLSPEFRNRFESMRKQRNAGIHSTGKALRFEPAELVESILFVQSELFPDEDWVKVRGRFLENSRQVQLGDYEWVTNILCREIQAAIELLSPSLVKRYLKVFEVGSSVYVPRVLPECESRCRLRDQTGRTQIEKSRGDHALLPRLRTTSRN